MLRLAISLLIAFGGVGLQRNRSIRLVAAATREEVTLVDQLVPVGSFAQPTFFAAIHGMGNVDFGNLRFVFQNTTGTTIDSASLNKQHAKYNDNNDKDETSHNTSVPPHVLAVVIKLSRRPTASEMFEYTTNQTMGQELLSQQGIGAWGTDGVYYGCCTPTTLSFQFANCRNNSDLGTIIRSENKMENGMPRVQTRAILSSESTGRMGMERVVWADGSGSLAIIVANCGPTVYNSTISATSVRIHGTVTITSFVSASTLPLYLGLTACHAYLCLWYRRLMVQHSESHIPVEDWIFYALILAASATMFHTLLYTAEAFSEKTWLGLTLVSQFVLSMSHAVSRCLYLLLAMGVGVTTPTVQSHCIRAVIVILLCTYLFSNTIEDLANLLGSKTPFIFAGLDLQATVGLILWIWIPLEIRKTIRFLESRNETHKVERYEWIWKGYLLATGLTVLQYTVLIFDVSFNAGRDINFMNINEYGDIIYLTILACLSYLWRPNPSQLIYSYQLLDDAGEFPEPTSMSLELSEVASPSDDTGGNKDAGLPTMAET